MSNIYLLQVGGVPFAEPPKRQRLTRSLLSGSEKSFSSRSESEGGSCDTAPYSKPYLLRSATDAASAAIDYSKGDVEDGVVDSPPSRGPVRTPICSPSPLKRASSSRGYSLSPNPRTDARSSRKLNLPLDEAPEHPRLDDGVPTPLGLPNIHIDGLKSTAALEDETRSVLLRSTTDVTVLGLEDKGPRPLQSSGATRSPSVDTLGKKQRISIDYPRPVKAKSTATQLPYMENVNASLSRPPLRGSRSLSTSEAPQTSRWLKRKVSGAESQSLCDALGGGSWPIYRSRREDILKGLAKIKAQEAARNNRTEMNK